jgi:hypothetical protein
MSKDSRQNARRKLFLLFRQIREYVYDFMYDGIVQVGRYCLQCRHLLYGAPPERRGLPFVSKVDAHDTPSGVQ